MIGSVTGALTATEVNEDILRTVIAIVMLVLLVVLLVNYTGIIKRKHEIPTTAHKFFAYPLLVIAGFYGGFIQLGVGIFLLSILMLLLGYEASHGNAIKNMLNFFLTFPAFIVFAWKGQVQWEFGLIVAVGQTTGAYLAARFATSYPNAPVWIRMLLIIMSAVTAAKLFGLF